MVCKFANNGCDLYDPEAHARTCEKDNGGPFMIHPVDGKLVRSAYCGRYRSLDADAEKTVLLEA